MGILHPATLINDDEGELCDDDITSWLGSLGIRR